MKESVIKWQTGEPKEEGKYLVDVLGKTVEVDYLFKWEDIENGHVMTRFAWVNHWATSVTAWCKLSDIKPYKEEEL